MMKSTFLVVAIAIATITSIANAACTPKDKPSCEDFSGTCSSSVNKFLTASSPDATIGDMKSVAKTLVTLFKYGKYCGSANACPSANLEKAENGPEPCNDIDQACMEHDACINNLDGNGYPEQCECDIQLVAAMIPNTPGIGAGPTDQLCDETFYTDIFPPPNNNIEAAVIALPFCLEITNEDNGCTVPVSILEYCYYIEDFLLD